MYVFFFSFLNALLGDSFCVSSQRHYHTSSWLVPNKPLVNPPVRFVFFATRRGGLFSLFSLFSLSLSNRKGVFLLRVFLVSFLDSDSKTIRRDDVHTCTRSITFWKSVSKQRAFGRENARRARGRRRNRRVSSLSFFR